MSGVPRCLNFKLMLSPLVQMSWWVAAWHLEVARWESRLKHNLDIMKTYFLKPIMTPSSVAAATTALKHNDPGPQGLASASDTKISPQSKPVNLPPRQHLPCAVIDPSKPILKLGLDVHLDFIMAVVQRGHSTPQVPRKFTRQQLVAQVQRWTAEGLQVFCVQESCGFGF